MHVCAQSAVTDCGAGRLFCIPQQVADAFFKDLQREAFVHTEEVLGEVAIVAQRLWTSAKTMA
jgi:hypothetical protein